MHEKLAPERIRLNYHDYCALPNDGKRYEILDADLHVSPSPRTIHQRVLLRLADFLVHHVRTHNLGEVFVAPYDVVLTDTDIVQPDIVFVSRAKASIVTAENIRGVPDLLVEVLSESNPEYDTRDKRHIYARCGVPFYWMVDPANKTLTELQLVDRDYARVVQCKDGDTFTPRLFAELTVEVDSLWRMPQ